MASERHGEPHLAAQLSRAISGYNASWKSVDSELYDLCSRRNDPVDFADVYTKVAVIGRVYAAGVARSWRSDGDPESEIAKVLIEPGLAELIQSGLLRLYGHPLDRQRAAEIIELHGHVTRAISHRSGNRFLTSFVSKYLHFHCPIVPIYDNLAQSAIGKFIDQRTVDHLIREDLTALSDWTSVYRRFVAAFVLLYERAHAEPTLNPTVKQLDQMLWQQN
jgi:hypothetical protein